MIDHSWLPNTEHVVYKSPPLVLVVCQVQFSEILGITDSSIIRPFHESIRNRFPVVKRREELTYTVNASIDEASIRKQKPTVQWQFSGLDTPWIVLLAPNFITLETREYRGFTELLNNLKFVLSALIENLNPSIIERIGLRYINEIRPKKTVRHRRNKFNKSSIFNQSKIDWTKVISSPIIGALEIPEIRDSALLSIQELRMLYSNTNEGITIRHGLLPDGSTVETEEDSQKPRGPFYLLDFDLHHQFQSSIISRFEVEQICQQIINFNEVIYKLFNWSVTQDYRNQLEK